MERHLDVVESVRDTTWTFRVQEAGEGFRASARAYFGVDRNRLEAGRGQVLTVRYSVVEPSRVRLRVYNVAGEVVRVLHEGDSGIGERRLQWDGRDEEGRLVSPGLYLVYYEAGAQRQIAKVLVTR